MNSQLTPKDWELLSAYLDGQLTDLEKRHVQAMLAQRSDLGLGLDELRRTRAVLRAAPQRRAPRNFTLTPAMVQKPQRRLSWSWAPTFGFASGLATILFVLSFFFRLTPLAAAPAFAPAAAQDRVFSQDAAASQASAPPIIQYYDSGRGGGPPGMGGGDAYAVPNAASGIQPSTAPEVGPAMVPTEAAATELNNTQNIPEASPEPPGAAKSAAPTATTGTPALAAPMAASPPAANAAPAVENGPILGVAPSEERGKIIVPTQEANELLYASQPVETGSDWPWVQGGLAAAALACGMAAFWIWRRSRH